MASATRAPASPQADVFLPSTASGGGTVGGGKILGMDRKTATIVGVVALALVAYLVYRHYSNSASAASGTASDSSNIDPQTGYPYGSAADLAALGAGPSGSAGGSSGDTGSLTPTKTGGGSNQGESADLLGIISQLIGSGSPSTNGNQGTSTGPSTTTTTTSTKAQTVDSTSKAPQVGGGVQAAQTQLANTDPLTGGSFEIAPSTIYGGIVPPVAASTPAPSTALSPYAVASTSSKTAASPTNKTGLSANKTQGVFSTH